MMKSSLGETVYRQCSAPARVQPLALNNMVMKRFRSSILYWATESGGSSGSSFLPYRTWRATLTPVRPNSGIP